MASTQKIIHLPRTDSALPRDLREDLMASLLIMAWIVEARDPYTGGHLWRVSRFSRLLAEDGGLPGADVARIAIGGFLHDLGKISTPDHILGKKGSLTEEEYEIIKTHPEVGWRVLSAHPLSILGKTAVLAHHERPDGAGYPHRLSGAAIPIDARIVGVCDAFDAMTSTRPYRPGMPVEKALSIIEENLGKQFDSALGTRFVALGRSGQLDHIVGHSDQGIPLHTCQVCGPTLVVRRGQKAGEHVYCRSCAGEYMIEGRDGKLAVVPTGRRGAPLALELEVDTQLIADMVRESAQLLSAI